MTAKAAECRPQRIEGSVDDIACISMPGRYAHRFCCRVVAQPVLGNGLLPSLIDEGDCLVTRAEGPLRFRSRRKRVSVLTFRLQLELVWVALPAHLAAYVLRPNG